MFGSKRRQLETTIHSDGLGTSDPLPALQIVQRTFTHPHQLGECYVAFAEVMHRELWRVEDGNGNIFPTFSAYAIHPRPRGLGVRQRADADLLRHLCMYVGEIEPWIEVMEIISRPCGHPPKATLTDSMSFKPFYSVSPSPTAVDRICRRLKHEAPDEFKAVCAGALTPHQAAKKLNWIKSKRASSRLYIAETMTLRASFLRELSAAARLNIVRQIWDVLSQDQRQEFLKDLEPSTA